MNILRAYNACVSRRPLLALALTSAGGMATGNILCQSIMYKKTNKFSLQNVVEYAMFGFLISGPLLRYWWHALDLKIFKNPKSFMRPLKMMIADQSTTPFVLNALFLYYLGYAENLSHQKAMENVNTKLWPIVVESYKIWPLAMLINFYLIPLNYRVLFSNSVAILWTGYFTYMVSREEK